MGSSPLTRGKLNRLHEFDVKRGLIPAHAGKTERAKQVDVNCGAHPRSRGENHFEYAAPETIKGSSPLTRGKL